MAGRSYTTVWDDDVGPKTKGWPRTMGILKWILDIEQIEDRVNYAHDVHREFATNIDAIKKQVARIEKQAACEHKTWMFDREGPRCIPFLPVSYVFKCRDCSAKKTLDWSELTKQQQDAINLLLRGVKPAPSRKRK